MRVFASSSFVSVRSSPSLWFLGEAEEAKSRCEAKERRLLSVLRLWFAKRRSEELKQALVQPKKEAFRYAVRSCFFGALARPTRFFGALARPTRKHFGKAEEAHQGAPRRTEAPSEDAQLRKQRYEEAKQTMCRNTSRRSEAKTKEQNKRKLITSWFCEANFELKIPKAQ
uniref:Uncharacterized protein n=1 Tax=Pediastrum duplex TaxID=3105 RepID=A0A2U8GIP4_PEDDU|nr:hypothetical protein [Pediastrum duplex]